tara:strand:- start:335 stop:553 length:219 start_codon:yes stop_codon:yes gene_type:complete
MSQTQPFIFTGNDGNYMVLHQLNEKIPEECKEFVEEKTLIFDPPTDAGGENWAPVDSPTIKRFVHQYFGQRP